MIEILKVKREFLYLLLTLTQEKNVKVSRFPLIHLDETILAHTNLAEFHKFLQEKENEALLDRMVIVKVPYTLSYNEEARIYHKLVSARAGVPRGASRPARAATRRGVRDSHAPAEAGARGPRSRRRSCGSTPARDVEGFTATEVDAAARRVARRRPDRREPALRHQRDLQRDHAQRHARA